MQDMSQELLQPCAICGKQWTREDVAKFIYYDGTLVCKEHKGAIEWANFNMRLMAVKLAREGVYPADECEQILNNWDEFSKGKLWE